MAKIVRKSSSQIVKSVCFDGDPQTRAFIEAQHNISRSIRLLVKQYIVLHHGQPLDVCEEYEAALEEQVFKKLTAGGAPAMQALPVQQEASSQTIEKAPVDIAPKAKETKPIGFTSPIVACPRAVSYAASTHKAAPQRKAAVAMDIPEGYL